MNKANITAAPRREGGPVAGVPAQAGSDVQAAMDRVRGARQQEIAADGNTPAVQTPVEPSRRAWGLLDKLTKTQRRVLGAAGAGSATLLFTSGCNFDNPFTSDAASADTQNPTTGEMKVMHDGEEITVTVTNANNNEVLGDDGDTYIVDGKVVTIGAGSTDTNTTDDAPESEITEESMQYRDFHLTHGASFKVVDGYLVIEAGGIEGQTEGVRISLEGRGLVLKSDARIDGSAYPVDPASGTPMYDEYGSAGYKEHTGSVAFLLPDADCGAEEAIYVHTEWGGNLELVPLEEAANTGKTYFDELKEAVEDQSTGDYTDGGLVYDMGQGGALVATVPAGANLEEITENIVGTETEISEQYRDFHLAHGASFKVVDGYLVIEAGGIEGQTEGVRISLEGRGLVLKSDARIDGSAYPVDPASGTPMYDEYGSAGYKEHTGSVAFLLPDADCGAEEAIYVHTQWGGNLELVPVQDYVRELKEAVEDQSTGDYTDGGLVYDMGQGGAFITKVAPGTNLNAITGSIVGTELDKGQDPAPKPKIYRRVLTMA